jgi:hypothetical protein
MLAQFHVYIFLFFFFMAHTCRGCRREFDSRGALSTHKRSCSSKIADAVASSLAKRRHDRETQQAVKIRRREEAEAELMARQDMREHFAEPDLPPVCSLIFHIVVSDALSFRILVQGLHHHLPHIVCQVYQIAAAAYRKDSAMTYRLSQW